MATVLLLVLPGVSTGQVRGLELLVHTVERATKPITSAATRPDPGPEFRVPGDPPDYQPPLHGQNPHGQGTVLTYDADPSDTRPLTGDPDGAEGDPENGDDPNQEEVVIGRSRGERNPNGTYHGHVTVLALLGNEVVGVDTVQNTPDQPQTIPGDVTQPLSCPNDLAPDANIFVCLDAATASSETNGTSSTNSFGAAGGTLQVGGGDFRGGEDFQVDFGVAESEGNISEEPQGCQTATGSSSVANVTAGPPPPEEPGRGNGDGSFSADLMSSSSESTDCPGTSNDTVTNESSGAGIDPGPPSKGEDDLCAEGEPDTSYFIGPTDFGYCNADDTNGQPGDPVNQAQEPYGVREAFTFFEQDSFIGCFPPFCCPPPFEFLCDELEPLLESAGLRGGNGDPDVLFKATFAASESKATQPSGGGGGGGGGGGRPPDQPGTPPDQPGTPPEQPGTPPSPTEPPDEPVGDEDEQAPGREGEARGEEPGAAEPGTVTAPAEEQGRLSFTGSNLLLIGLLGALALFVGLHLRALTRRLERRS